MKGDFSRDTFDPAKHYAAVLKQQGRVDLDADWNEDSAVQRHVEETTTRDVVGACGAPQDGGGFQIAYTETEAGPGLSISAGRIYVDGILCELESPTSYSSQADHPDPPALTPVVGRTDLVYLDVWQRHITYVEDPELREVALGGPDTATRLQTVAEVKFRSNVGNITCADNVSGWPPAPSGGLLTTSVVEAEAPVDPCALAAAGGYRGLENRLYRVEVHQGGNLGTATFKWSRDNGAVVYAIEEFIDGQPTAQLRLSSLGRDRVLRLQVGQWVEVLDDATELSSTGPGSLLQITDLDESERLITLSAPVSGLNLGLHPKVRRWDQGSAAITITADTLELEDGVQVTFGGGSFHTGDYWMFAARTVIGQVEELTSAPPQGLRRHYCALALVVWQQTAGAWTPVVHDCRHLFPPLTGLLRYFYLGGSGQEALPGQALPELLRVGVMNGQQPVAGALVRFAADKALSRVAPTLASLPAALQSSIVVATGADGTANCAWRLDPVVSDRSQLLVATLLDASQVATEHPPIRFNANHSIASQVWYDSQGCINPSNPDTVQEALADLCGNYFLHYAGGDGQEAMPGQPLPALLRVRVANGQWPVQGAPVQFSADSTGARVADSLAGLAAATEASIILHTGADGTAGCAWLLDPDVADPSQVLTATLLDASESVPLHPPVHFTGNHSIASQVWYDPAECINPNNPGTVQEALDNLCANYSLHYAGGDGQEAAPGQTLPFPLQARVANGQWPVPGVSVTFQVTQGGGAVDAGAGGQTQLTVATDANGLASCQWTLGNQDPQQVVAFMAQAPDLTLAYNATISAASAGIHVRDILLSGRTERLLNDSNVPVARFAPGLRILCDRRPDPDSLVNKPVVYVTLELPYPLNDVDQRLWGVNNLVGFQPIVLAADLKPAGTSIQWIPNPVTRSWLVERLFQVLVERNLPARLLARLTIKGNFIWDVEARSVYLDGEVFGVGETGFTRLRLPSGDGQPGGDLEMWFWLVPSQAAGPALVAVDDFATTLAGSPIAVNVLANDTGAAPLRITAVTPGGGDGSRVWRRGGLHAAGSRIRRDRHLHLHGGRCRRPDRPGPSHGHHSAQGRAGHQPWRRWGGGAGAHPAHRAPGAGRRGRVCRRRLPAQ